MAAKGNVDLIIRAKNEATKNLDQINKSLKDLSDQQQIVGDSAGKADDKLARLGQELAKLRTNAQNLNALSTVGSVLDKATAALQRQRDAAEQAGAEYTDLAAQQQRLAAQSTELSGSTRAATAEVKRQDAALKQARTNMSELGRESTRLNNQETSLQSALTSVASALVKRRQALEEAAQKQAGLTAAISSSEKVTKAQQNSLDAANRALERRQKAVDESVAKEAELLRQLSQLRVVQGDHTAAVLNGASALSQQITRTNEAKVAASGLQTQVTALAKAERDVARDTRVAGDVVERQAASLKEAEVEYSKVKDAAGAARAAVAGASVSTRAAGEQAGRAAVQVAAFAARLAVLAGTGGSKTSNPLGLDPRALAEADGKLREVGVTIRAAGNEAAKASVSTKDMENAIRGAGAAAQSLKEIRTGLSQQEAAIDGARVSWKAAEAEVRRLALAIRATEQPSEAMAAALGKAQGQARLAKDEFVRQKAALEQIIGAFQRAGVGTGTLGSVMGVLATNIQRAEGVMQSAVSAAQKLGTQVRQQGQSANTTTPQMNRLATAIGAVVANANRMGSATNPMRMFKNELVAMVAAGTGLYAIKEQLVSIWDAGSNLAANTSKFAVAFGSMEAGSKELEYSRTVALNLKLPIDTLTKSYADLALAAKGTAMEGQGARDVFIGFAQTARVNQTSAESLDGTFKALTQIMSKGKVQAEELRQQLGDRMPGSMQLMAEGLGVTTEKLDKMMEKGELTRQTLLNMAAAASGRVSAQLTASLSTPAAKLADFQNRLLVFKETIAGSGFLDAVAEAFDRMAKALSTPEAIQGAKDLGAALAEMITWLLESAQHFDTIVTVVKSLAAAWATLQIGNMVAGLYGLVASLGATTIAALGLEVALSPILIGLAALSGIVAGVAALFGAWKLAQWAYDNFPVFAEGVMTVKNAALNSWDAILQFWEMTAVKLKASFGKVTAQLADIWYGMLDAILSAFPKLTSTLGLGDYAAEIAQRAAEASAALEKNEADTQAKLDEIRQKYAEKEKGRQKALQDDIAGYYKTRLAEEKKEAPKAGAKARGGAPMGKTPGPEGTQLVTAAPYVPSTEKADEAAAKKAATARLQLEQSVANQMFTIRAQLEKKSADTLDQQVAAVGAKYAKLYGQLTALGKDKASQEWKDVDALVAQEQALIRQNAQKKAEREAAKTERAAEAAENKSRVDAMKIIEAMYKTRQNLQEQLARAQKEGDDAAINELQTKIAQVTLDAANATTGMITFWEAVDAGGTGDAAIAKLQQLELQLTKVNNSAILTGGNIAKAFGSAAKNAMDSFVDSVASGTKPIDAMKNFFIDFARQFLINIAKMILQQMLLNAIMGVFGNVAGTAGGYMTAGAGGTAAAAGSPGAQAGVLHTGGVVGSAGPTRSVDPGIFRGAAVHHDGGVIGLKSNEVPIIAEKGEEMLTADDPRHVSNGGAGKQAPINLKMINMVDSASVVSEGLNTSEGEEVFMNIIKANRTTIRGLLA